MNVSSSPVRRLALQVELSQLEVSRLSDLEIRRRPEHNGHLSARALYQAGFICSDEFIGCGLSEGAPQKMAAEALGCLRLHDILARNRRCDDGAIRGPLDLLDGVHRRQTYDRGVVLFDGANRALDGCGVD